MGMGTARLMQWGKLIFLQLCFILSAIAVVSCMGTQTGPVLTMSPAPRTNRVFGGINKDVWGLIWLQQDLAPSSSCLLDSTLRSESTAEALALKKAE